MRYLLMVTLAAFALDVSAQTREGMEPGQPGIPTTIPEQSTTQPHLEPPSSGSETDVHGSLNSNIGNHTEDNSITEVNGDTYSGQYVSHNSNRVEAQAPPVSAPVITTGYDTCAMAVSGGASGPGFGLSFGKNKVDQTCERLKLAKMLQSMNMKDAAVALMLQDERVLAAVKVSNPQLAELLGPKDEEQTKDSNKPKSKRGR